MARIHWLDILLAPLTWVERTRGRRRLALLGLYAAVLGVGGVLAGREAVLWRLPDCIPVAPTQGRPRDLPAADDAMVLFRAASRRLVRDDALFRSLPQGVGLPWDWGAVDPRLYPWIEANRPALDLWLRATARPDASRQRRGPEPGPVASPGPDDGVYDGLITLGRLAAIEATRLLDVDDPAGAWTYQMALLRSAALVGRAEPRGNSLAVFVARRPIVPPAWLNHPALTVPLLRRAIVDVDACLQLRPTLADLIRAEHFERRAELSDPASLLKWRQHWIDEAAWYNQIPGAAWLVGFLRNEPRRSLKVLDLVTLGELAQADRPPAARARLVDFEFQIYAVDAATPEPLRRVAPARLVEWVRDSNAQFGIPVVYRQQRAILDRWEQLDRARFTLAERAYELDHGGEAPTTYGDLTPTYVAAPPAGAKPGDPLPHS